MTYKTAEEQQNIYIFTFIHTVASEDEETTQPFNYQKKLFTIHS